MSGLPGLHTAVLGRSYLHLDTVSSTNDYLKENAHMLPHGTAVTASLQTGGKGRLGRAWSEERDRGLALSVLLQDWTPERLSLLPLIAGLAVCRGVRQLCGVDCGIKWSNDVLLGGKKLCGILCESRITTTGSGFAVVGIGVNLLQTEEEFIRLGLVYAASLVLATGKCYGTEETAAAILNALEPVLQEYASQGFDGLLDEYKRWCVTLGRPVRVLWHGAEAIGTAVDIAADGSLLVEIDGKICPVSAGEASVRGLYGYV